MFLKKFFIQIFISYVMFFVILIYGMNNIVYAQSSDEDQIQTCVEDFLEGIRLGDINRFMKNVSNDFLRASVNGEFVDKQGFRQEVLSLWKEFSLVSIDNIEMNISIKGNIAGVLLKYSLIGKLVYEHKKRKVDRFSFLLFEKQRGYWELIFSYDLPTKKENIKQVEGPND